MYGTEISMATIYHYHHSMRQYSMAERIIKYITLVSSSNYYTIVPYFVACAFISFNYIITRIESILIIDFN